MPNLISRRQYNDRRKITAELCETIRKRIVERIDGGEGIFITDSKPVKVCQLSREKRNRIGMKEPEKAPDFGYCAAQSMYYYGYKLHAVCCATGVIHSYDLTQACVHNLKYLNDVGLDFFQCTIIGDKGYLVQKCRQTCLRVHSSNSRCHIASTRRIGNRFTSLSVESGKGSRPISRSSRPVQHHAKLRKAARRLLHKNHQ